jgi:crotonobetainyl-CoA:carnitine CoA-transferase CaiB-like acyl-CoA transferase
MLTTARMPPVAPRLGEHDGEILCELGYDEKTIKTLVAAGVIAVP